MRFPSTLGIAAILMLAAAPASADDGIGKIEHGVPAANKRIGTPRSLIDPDFRTKLLATGTDSLENPSGKIVKFGFLSDGTLTEPDENTFLVFDKNPGGPDSTFDYGRHFLFQGHENGGNLAYITRINLQVPHGNSHRITLLTPVDPVTGLTGFNSIDGSTYNPFTKTLLFTEERSSSTLTGAGRVIQMTPNWPPKFATLEAFLGLGGYEGVHSDDKGNIYLVEDIGGVRNATTQARKPNSFVYRFLPNDASQIEKGGELQALQVLIGGTPVLFNASDPDGDIMSIAQLNLHTPGTSYPVKWVTIHTSNAGDTAAFDANAEAKAAGATPFKHPENMAWLPGSNFATFFDPTGDTNAVAGGVPDLAARGAFGSISRVDLQPSKPNGRISIFVLGDPEHNSFDNLAFADEKTLLAAEDRGDTLHDQLNPSTPFGPSVLTPAIRFPSFSPPSMAPSPRRSASSRWGGTRRHWRTARTTSRPAYSSRTAALARMPCLGPRRTSTAHAASSPGSTATIASLDFFTWGENKQSESTIIQRENDRALTNRGFEMAKL